MKKKIAVLRANAVGDFIFVLPALQALRERYPNAEIVLLGRDWHKEYLAARPGPVDRVIVVPPYPGISEREGFTPDPEELNAFFDEMQREEFDMAFQLHGGGKNSNPFVVRLGAKLSVGLKTPDAAPLDISVPYIYWFSEILRYLEVVAKVGASPASIQPLVEVTSRDREEAAPAVQVPAGRRLAIIHPGASDLRRRWPEENFAAIADLLVQEGYLVAITGMPFEGEMIGNLVSQVRNQEFVINMCGQLTLGGTTALISEADMLISNDTGPLHLARALNTPTVGIYWCGNYITGMPMAVEYNRSLLSFTLNCPLCGLHSKYFNSSAEGDCKHETSFVAEVTVEDVTEAIRDLIALGKPDAKAAVAGSVRQEA